MPNVTLRDVPAELHHWLKQRAADHHRSVNKDVIALLDGTRKGTTSPAPRATFEDIMAISHRAARLPVRDRRSEDEILGYDRDGIPD
jgi:plasmid stability protein